MDDTSLAQKVTVRQWVLLPLRLLGRMRIHQHVYTMANRFNQHFLLLLLSSLSVTVAHAAPAHEHGVAAINISMDGNIVNVAMDSPLDNLLGFEHAPSTPHQREQVHAMAHRLRAAEMMFAFNPQAHCKMMGATLASAVLPPLLLGEAGTPPVAAPDAPPGHADLDANFEFRCSRPDQLRQMTVGLFAAFPGFHQIRVQAVTDAGQAAATLTPEQATFSWPLHYD
jgi:hypothetical protein